MIVLGFKGKFAKTLYPLGDMCTYYIDFNGIENHQDVYDKIEYILSFNKMSLNDALKFPGHVVMGAFPEFDSEKHLQNFVNYLNKNCLIRVYKNIL